MRSFEEINELLDKVGERLDKVGERLERTERIVNANSDGYAETRKILREIAESNKELAKSNREFDKHSKEFDKRSKEFDKRSKEFDKRSKDFDERSKEFDKRFKNNGDDFERMRKNLDERRKSSDENFERMEKNLEEVGKKLDKTASVVNGIGDSNGIVAEEFFIETTKEGLHVDGFGHLEQKTCHYIIRDSDKNERAEFDIVFTNRNFIFIVEVKYRLDKKQLSFFTEQKEKGVDKGLNRIEIFEKYDEEWIGNRTIVTAFACLGAKKKVIETFKEKGYYVLVREPNDTYKLFSPR